MTPSQLFYLNAIGSKFLMIVLSCITSFRMAGGIAALKKLKETNPYPLFETLGEQIRMASIR